MQLSCGTYYVFGTSAGVLQLEEESTQRLTSDLRQCFLANEREVLNGQNTEKYFMKTSGLHSSYSILACIYELVSPAFIPKPDW